MTKQNRGARVAVSIFYFIQGVVFATWASRIPDIKSALSLDEITLGSLLFAIPLGQISAMALSAWLVGRFTSRRLLIFAAILNPLVLLAISFMGSPAALAAALFAFGIVTNFFNISVNTQGVDVEYLYDRNIMAKFHGLWSLGGFTGGVLSMIVVAAGLSTTQHFALVTAAAIVTSIVMAKGLVREDIKPEGDDGVEPTKKRFFERFDSYILLLGIMVFGAMFCEGTMYDWSSIYFADVVEAPEKLIRLGYIVCMCTMTLGRFLADALVTRWGAAAVIRGSGVLIAVGLMMAVIAPTLIVATIGFFFVGFGISSTVPICYSMAGRSKSLPAAAALAAVSTIGYLGFLIGPPIIGFIAHLITLRWTFAVTAAVGVTIAILSSRLKNSKN